MANVTRTSMFLDRDLVARAQRELGTATVVETVHEALRRAVRSERALTAFDALAEMEWMSNEELEELEGRPRDWDPFEGVTEEHLAEARRGFQQAMTELKREFGDWGP